MTKNLISIIIIGMALTACSTSPKSTTTGEEADTAAAAKTTQTKPNQSNLVEMKPADVKAEAAAPAKPVKYDALNAAIESKNQDRIKSQSLEILQSNPRDLKALNSLAMSHFSKGNTEAAMTLLNKMISIEPKSSSAYANLGLVYLARNERRPAMEMFKKSLEIDSDNYVAAANLGSIYVREKDYPKAVIALENVIDDKKIDELTLNNYAIALTATGKPDEAAKIYERAIEKNSSNKTAMLNLSIVYIDKLKKFDEGLDLINRLKFVGPDSESRQIIKDLEIKAKAGLK